MFGIGLNPRGLTSVYEDARTLGVVLVGAGVLGLAGIGELQLVELEMREGAVVTAVVGTTSWALSILRPTITKEERS